jgi:hypothetical protein
MLNSIKKIAAKFFKKHSFTCACCGTKYKQLPLCFGSDHPDYYFSVPPNERAQRIELKESLCVIDDKHFHRGRITIPIIDYHEDLIFNVWTSISEPNFELRNKLWNNPTRVEQDAYFGWLQTIVPTYGNTLNIKTIARENEVGIIPSIEIIEEDHPLLHDQQRGINYSEVINKVQQILSASHKASSLL